MLDVALVGLGSWGRTLVDAVQEDGRPTQDELRFTSVVPRVASDAVRDYAAHQRLRVATLEEALADPAIGGVLLATPHSLHGAQILAAARAGKHVFCEKPVTLTRAELDAGIAACERAGVVLAAGFNRRFLPAAQALRDAARGGALGRVLHLEANASSPSGFAFVAQSWRASERESPAGAMGTIGIHMIDQFVWMNGPIAAVACQATRRALEVPVADTTSMLLRFRDGSTGSLVTMAATARCWQLRVLGSRGWAQLRDLARVETSMVDGAPATREYPAAPIERLELEAFARACRGAAPYPVPLDEVANGVSAWEAIARSAAAGGIWQDVA